MQIDVYQDTVCPWCRIGKRELELALQDFDSDSVDVNYHSFFLDPTIPPEGREFRSFMAAKGGGRIPLQQFFDAPSERGESVGLTFNFEDIMRAPNTTLSHQLVAITPDHLKTDMLNAIYAAYFEHGQDIGDIEILVETAGSVGLDRDDTRARLVAGDGRAQVKADIESARQLGISGVPFYVINNQYGFSGAQPAQAIRRILDQVVAETSATA